jgi:preprotein translocase subunit SecG
MLYYIVLPVHIVVCLLLIVVVLLQKGKGQDFASTFGGGGTQTAFGARSGATVLHRATTVAAVLFMITSLTLTILLSQPGQNSVLGSGDVEVPAQQPAPVLPLTPPSEQETAAPAAPAGEDQAAPATNDDAGGLTPAEAPAEEAPQPE